MKIANIGDLGWGRGGWACLQPSELTGRSRNGLIQLHPHCSAVPVATSAASAWDCVHQLLGGKPGVWGGHSFFFFFKANVSRTKPNKVVKTILKSSINFY